MEMPRSSFGLPPPPAAIPVELGAGIHSFVSRRSPEELLAHYRAHLGPSLRVDRRANGYRLLTGRDERWPWMLITRTGPEETRVAVFGGLRLPSPGSPARD